MHRPRRLVLSAAALGLALAATALTLPVMPVVPLPNAAAQAEHNGYYHGRTWRDSQGRLRCRRKNGTTGLIIGGAAGAIAGRAIDGGRNKALGTILGGAAGALAGRAVERGQDCR